MLASVSCDQLVGGFKGIRVLARGLFLAIILTSLVVSAAGAQTVSEPSVTLAGNHPFEATSFRPVSHPNPSAQLNTQVTLGLRNGGELDKLLRDQQNPASPRYHQWLTPGQFTARFGPSQQDLNAVVQWLDAQGFKITAASLALRYVRFSGAVADAERAFGTDIMAFGDGNAYSNITDPAIPSRFSGVITTVSGLDNFLHSKAASHFLPISRLTSAAASGLSAGPLAFDSGPPLPMPQRGAISSVPDVNVGGTIAFGPSDVYSFYNETPLLNSGINGGGGGCIAVVGDSNYTHSAVDLFNSTFSLPASSITTVKVNGWSTAMNSRRCSILNGPMR
jgi:subtilase family serine protease